MRIKGENGEIIVQNHTKSGYLLEEGAMLTELIVGKVRKRK